MAKTTQAEIEQAVIALQQGKVVKTQQNGKEVQVLQLIPGLFGTSWQMRYVYLGTVDYAYIMANKAFIVY